MLIAVRIATFHFGNYLQIIFDALIDLYIDLCDSAQ